MSYGAMPLFSGSRPRKEAANNVNKTSIGIERNTTKVGKKVIMLLKSSVKSCEQTIKLLLKTQTRIFQIMKTK